MSGTRRFRGAPGPIRTVDTSFRRAVLCPLSYGGLLPILRLINGNQQHPVAIRPHRFQRFGSILAHFHRFPFRFPCSLNMTPALGERVSAVRIGPGAPEFSQARAAIALACFISTQPSSAQLSENKPPIPCRCRSQPVRQPFRLPHRPEIAE